MENSKDIEDLTDLIGHYGKYQKLLLGLVIYVGIFSAFNNLNLPFLAPKIDYWCSRLPEYLNTSIEEWKNFSIPIEIRNGKHVYSKCEIYEEAYRGHYSIDSPSVPCSSWEYDHSNYKSTITEQWGLVCENSWMISFAGSIYFVGFLVTAFVSGQLSDRFGRRPVVLSCIIINSVFGITCTISPYYWMFATSRFLLSFGRAGLFLSWLILVVEIMGPKHRTRVSTSDKIGWATGQIILPGIAWLVKDWYYIQLASTLPVILLIFLWKYIPESPRWLLSHGKFHEADIIIRKIMTTNGKKVDELDVIIRKLAFKIKMEDKDKTAKNITFIDLFKNIQICKLTLLQYFIWMVTVFAFYGLSFNADDTGGSVYLFYVLCGLMDYPSALLMQLLVVRIGRRYPLLVFLLISGICCIVASAIPDDMTWLRIVLAVSSKFCLSTALSILYIFSSEIYPTPVRNVGLGSCSMMGRIGAIIAPFMKQASEMVHWALPFGIFGIMSIAAGLLALLLPETKNTHLTDCFVINYTTKTDDSSLGNVLPGKETVHFEPLIQVDKPTLNETQREE
ncbi:organic cation transporter protein-like [Centruroides vittatus]|uniref:organic cation transporter protein-like n=1 Tax=Centruroides vittatus TaxID=120091 RepID=UPI003510CA86